MRIINDADFSAVTPDATSKTHFVIVDAVGVTESELNDTKPLERNQTVALGSLLQSVAVGQLTPDIVSSVASRLARLDRLITREDRDELESLANVSLTELTHSLVEAADVDRQLAAAQVATGKDEPSEGEVEQAARALMAQAAMPLAANPQFRQRLIDVRRSYEQTIDEVSKDELLFAGASGRDATETCQELRQRLPRVHRGAPRRDHRAAAALQRPVAGPAELRPDQGTWRTPSSARRSAGRTRAAVGGLRGAGPL